MSNDGVQCLRRIAEEIAGDIGQTLAEVVETLAKGPVDHTDPAFVAFGRRLKLAEEKAKHSPPSSVPVPVDGKPRERHVPLDRDSDLVSCLRQVLARGGNVDVWRALTLEELQQTLGKPRP